MVTNPRDLLRRAAAGLRAETGLHARASKRFFRDGLPYLAQAVAFQALLSFVPFLLLVASFWDYWLGGNVESAADLDRALSLVFPFGAPRLNDSLDSLIRYRGLYATISLAALLWLAGSVFRTIDHSINLAFGTHDKVGPIRAQVKGVLLVFLFGTLLGLWILWLSLIAVLTERIPESIAPSLQVYEGFAMGVIVPIAVLAVVFASLFHVLPHTKVRWRDALRGGVLTAILWQLASRLFGYVLGRTLSYNLLSGTVTAVVAFLIWIYYGACIFLYGASLVATLGERRAAGLPREEIAHTTPEPGH